MPRWKPRPQEPEPGAREPRGCQTRAPGTGAAARSAQQQPDYNSRRDYQHYNNDYNPWSEDGGVQPSVSRQCVVISFALVILHHPLLQPAGDKLKLVGHPFSSSTATS